MLIYFWYYRKRYSYPCKKEIALCLKRLNKPLNAQITFAARVWANDPKSTLNYIAEMMGVTHERVRQYLWKTYYTVKGYKK